MIKCGDGGVGGDSGVTLTQTMTVKKERKEQGIEKRAREKK